MRKFEINKTYYESGITFLITGRTAKTIKYVEVLHAGRFNERRSAEKKASVKNWADREVFTVGFRTIEA